MLTNKKLNNCNNKYCSCNGIVRSGTCVAKKTVLEIVMNVSGTCIAIKVKIKLGFTLLHFAKTYARLMWYARGLPVIPTPHCSDVSMFRNISH